MILIGGNTYDYTVLRGVLSETTGTRQMTVHALVDGRLVSHVQSLTRA